MSDARERLLESLTRDVLGPQGGEDEVIKARPGDQYLTGALYPESWEDTAAREEAEEHAAEENDDREGAGDGEGGPGEAVAMMSVRRPSSMGISFSATGGSPRIRIHGSAGRYLQRWQKDGTLTTERGDRRTEYWQRVSVDLAIELPIEEGLHAHASAEGLKWWVRGLKDGPQWQVTVVLANILRPDPGREATEAATFFQTGFEIEAVGGTQLVHRRSRRPALDDDSRSNELIYRDASEWAVGHTCSASWKERPDRAMTLVATWIPTQSVSSMNPNGHPIFHATAEKVTGSKDAPFSAAALAAAASPEALVRLLGVVPAAYVEWQATIAEQVEKQEGSGALTPEQGTQARQHLERARDVSRRISAGIDMLGRNPLARRAFQLAQEAMLLQSRWKERNAGADLKWRPFQLGFQLMTLASLAEPGSSTGEATDDRKTMDLLWFPTGGGKTEAYLALTAFTFFLRRLRETADPDRGGGVAVLMRYTLRLLTVQQFERAARLVLACEFIRRNRTAAGDKSLGTVPFSIGMWVGNEATPGKVAEARDPSNKASARQLARCPACHGESLKWDAAPTRNEYAVICTDKNCPATGFDLPIWTVDEDVYRVCPSLLIGTVDKFAQIVRQPRSSAFFVGGYPPPELIIQDELHLISGPLGTIVGLYETAIDRLCTVAGIPPKVIGSTATIRRAEEQVKRLFDRAVMQFPPPMLDATDSCFAVVDKEAPGRVYVGISTAGRSPKFVLQAVCASLMQAASEPIVTDAERDPYWTLVAYFNSLRELGGALVMMHDDVIDSMQMYSTLHREPQRPIDEEPLELTGRVGSADIPESLKRLEKSYPGQPIAAVLATNMISVGVDIPRLGLMVVNGQPKSMAEYIQATSRVGRGSVAGLIVSVYNAGRPRDRSHYEAFRTWHQTLYREVEATSVTPFAPRARDRALHAAVVALARHLLPEMRQQSTLSAANRVRVEALTQTIVARAMSFDFEERDGVLADINHFLEEWERRGALASYWDDFHPDDSLLISAERAAAYKAVQGHWKGPSRPTPNSMREVEPDVKFRMAPTLKEEG